MKLNVDSISVMDVIKNRTSKSLEGYALLRKISRLIDPHDDVQISHSYREANKWADVLANEGCDLNCNFC